jgi:hypothetical protein
VQGHQHGYLLADGYREVCGTRRAPYQTPRTHARKTDHHMLTEQIDQMGDEEAIATTQLFGYDRYYYSHSDDEHCFWMHPEGRRHWKELCGKTKGDAARAFLKRHLKP